MSPDVPVRHSLYTPIGVKKEPLEDLTKKVLAQTPILQARLEYLDKQIAYYQSPQAFPKEAETDEKIHRAVLYGINRLLPMLIEERNTLQNQISDVAVKLQSDSTS